MPEVTAHTQGAPSWFDLATTDAAGALAFYGPLFGWEDDPQPMGEGWFYHIQKLGGLESAAIYEQMDEEKNAGVPPHWNVYFNVENVDAVAERAGRMGGSVRQGPFDVFDAGRVAIISDPQGAVFLAWQPKAHPGARVKYEPGAMCWNELLTHDTGAAIEFYAGLLGLEKGQEMDGMDYTLMRSGDMDLLGVMKISPEMGQIPTCWTVYFAVSDVDAAAGQVRSLGGGVTVPPTDIPGIGRFAVLTDPQGAYFNVFKGA